MADHGFEELLAPNLYFDNEHDIEAAKIMPGEYYVTARDMLLVTLLGSCVCLHTRYGKRHRRHESFHVVQQRERPEQSAG